MQYLGIHVEIEVDSSRIQLLYLKSAVVRFLEKLQWL